MERTADPGPAAVHTLGGRRFHVLTETTAEHDHWYMRQVRGAGLYDVFLTEGETPEAFARRLLGIAIDSGKEFLLISGMLVPESASGAPWSPAIATETAEFLKSLSAPEDKRQLNMLLGALIADFFAAGLISSAASSISSSGQPSHGLRRVPGESGPTSSERLQDSIPPGPTRSTGGPWWRRWWHTARSLGGMRLRASATSRSSTP